MDRDFKNKKISINPDGIIIGVPTIYKSFDELKGYVLKGMEGNKLTLEKDGMEKELYIHGSFDVIYLSSFPEEPNEKMCFGKYNPLECFLGKEITYVKKYGFRQYRGLGLPTQVFIGIDSDEIPIDVMMCNNDGAIMVYADPSLRNMSRIAAKLMEKDPEEWGKEDIKTMGMFRGAWTMQGFDKINIFEPLSEEEFSQKYPEVYKKVLNVKNPKKTNTKQD